MLVVERFRPAAGDRRRGPDAAVAARSAIGLCQVLALIPGVSRSGATIVGGMLLGLDRPAAAEFSFFLAMPTMAAAFAHDLLEVRHNLAPDARRRDRRRIRRWRFVALVGSCVKSVSALRRRRSGLRAVRVVPHRRSGCASTVRARSRADCDCDFRLTTPTAMQWLRRSFIAGFFVTVPLVISVAAFVWIFRLIDGFVGRSTPSGSDAARSRDRARPRAS